MSTVFTVFKKELTDHTRDKRTLLMILLLSVVMGPVVLILMSNFISDLEDKAEKREVQIVGREHAPVLVNYLLRQNMTLIDAPADFREQVEKGKLDAVLVIGADFQQDFARGQPAKIEMVFDDSRTSAGPAISVIRTLIRGFNAEVSTQRLIMRGVSPNINRVVELESTNMATPQQRAAMVLLVIPMIVLVACVSGGMSMAIDVTAGERERGSLEPLLMNPVGLFSLLTGKWLAVSTYAVVVVILILTGFWATLSYYPMPKLALIFTFNEWQLLGFLGILAPFALLMSAVQMLIATFGRTYKEAQTYLSYLTTVVSLTPALMFFANAREASWQFAVPAMGQQAVLMKILRGETVALWQFALPIALCVIGILVSLRLLQRLLMREDVIFGR